MGRQDDANRLDAEMLGQGLPSHAIAALCDWRSGPGARYAAGTGCHAIGYVPARWAKITPWPVHLAQRSSTDLAEVSRTEVVAATRQAAAQGTWADALVACYVWGQGQSGYGPHRLKEILRAPGIDAAVEQAAVDLGAKGAVAAYTTMSGAVPGLGPAFFTKLLYFLDQALRPTAAPRALILDQRLARVLRAHATTTGLHMHLPSAAATAAWIWSDGGWTPHRYAVYLKWMTAASAQLRAHDARWVAPDLLELALFKGAWDPSA